MLQALFPTILEAVATVLMALIAVFGSWLSVHIGKTKKLERTKTAMAALTDQVWYSVRALNQQLVGDWKKEGGKLTPEQVDELKDRLVTMTLDALSPEVYKVLEAASLDLEELIINAGDAMLDSIRKEAENAKAQDAAAIPVIDEASAITRMEIHLTGDAVEATEAKVFEAARDVVRDTVRALLEEASGNSD